MDQNKKWHFNRNGVLEEVAPERLQWGVIYEDGSELLQFDNAGVFHQIGEVDQSKVRRFVLHSEEKDFRLDIFVPEGSRLIHKYRTIGLDFGTPNFKEYKIYIFGYKDAAGVEHLHFVMPDNAILEATHDLNLEQFFRA